MNPLDYIDLGGGILCNINECLESLPPQHWVIVDGSAPKLTTHGKIKKLLIERDLNIPEHFRE